MGDQRGEIGREALKPKPALAALAPFVGEWRTTGTHPMVPGKAFHGRTSFAWHQGGAFVIMRSEIDEPDIPSGVAIFGSDDGSGEIAQIYFDERGVSRHYTVEIEDRTMRWRRTDPKIPQTMTLVASSDGSRMQLRGKLSQNGKPWEGDLTLDYRRV